MIGIARTTMQVKPADGGPTYVLSRAFDQLVVIARDASGRATARHATRQVWAPRLYEYVTGFSVVEGRGSKDWVLCVVAAGVALPPEAYGDADVRVLSRASIDRALDSTERADDTTRIGVSDIRVTAASGDTPRTLCRKVALALGHDASFDVGRF